MDDKQLDDHLQKGKYQASDFFRNTQLDTIRKATLHKVEQPPRSGGVRRKSKKSAALICIAAASSFIALMACFNIFGIIPSNNTDAAAGMPEYVILPSDAGSRPTDTASPISEQPVSFGNEAGDYLLGYYPLSFTHTEEPALVTTLWENGNEPSAQMVYSNVFEQSDKAYPVSILGFPSGNKDKLMLVSSGYSKNNHLHYRLVMYSDGTLTNLLSQDHVPGGSLGVRDGIVVEQRKSSDAVSNSNIRLSYIIPYIIDADGAITIPLDNLQLHVGDIVVFIGASNAYSLEASSQNGMALPIESRQPDTRQNTPAFLAGASGEDTLLLNANDSDIHSALALDIID